jgi:hypothetical protein
MSDEACRFYFGPQDDKSDEDILRILEYHRIAIVGLSSNPKKDSNDVARYLLDQGYEVVPVNPNHDTILGMRSYPSLRDVPGDIEIVNVFRRPDAVGPIVKDAIAIGAQVVWLQLQVVNQDAYEEAEASGLEAVMNRCIKVEHNRLMPSD